MTLVQKTIKKHVSLSGLGLHSGQAIEVALKPLPAGSGLWFKRVDAGDCPSLEAVSGNVAGTTLATTLGQGHNKISTVEHLMSAMGALGVDNLLAEVNGPEMPIFDGSAMPWVRALKSAGLEALNTPRPFYQVNRPFRFAVGDKSIEVRPASRFSVEARIDFGGPIGQGTFYYIGSPEAFEKEIAPARTFCYLKDVEMMQSRGLALGGSLDNAVVIGPEGVMNPDGLRFADEFVRHKVLDFVGDLALSRYPIAGHFTLVKPGHDLNQRFLAQALAEPGLLTLRTPPWLQLAPSALADQPVRMPMAAAMAS